MRKQAAALQIQKSYRCYVAWNSYSKLRSSAITLQAGLRVFGAYKEFNIRKQNKASIHIQVDHKFTILSKGKLATTSNFHILHGHILNITLRMVACRLGGDAIEIILTIVKLRDQC